MALDPGAFAARLPKVHLHCHLEGTLRPETFVELARRDGVPLRYRPGGGNEPLPPVDPDRPYRFADFQEFLWTFAAANRALSRPEDYARLAREFVADALAAHVVYGELFVSPSVWSYFHPNLDVRTTIAAIAAELRAAEPAAQFALIVDLTRNFGPEAGLQTARLAASLSDFGVVGIGLGGDEARFAPELFEAAFAFARSSGLHVVAHAGEAAGADSVRAAVERLKVERIGHGVRVLDDPKTLAMVAAKGIAFEVCPTSNRLTGAFPSDRHAFAELDRSGCIVTIDADDPAMFETSIEAEYAHVATVAGADALARYVSNAIDASFASPQAKSAMHAALGAELPAGRRTQGTDVGA